MLDSLSTLAKQSAPQRGRAATVVRKPAARPANKSKAKVKHTGTAVA
jgi:hypothetical protein